MTHQEKMELYRELDKKLTLARDLALKIVAHAKAKSLKQAA